MSGEKFSMDLASSTRIEFNLGNSATGNIGPALRELDTNQLTKLEQDIVSDRYDIKVIDGIFLPCGCIDGRCPRDEEAFNPVPNASGGTLTLLVGELLTNRSNIASTAQTTDEALASLIAYLQSLGYKDQIGGHTGPTHGNEDGSGCGANDALFDIFKQIATKQEVIASVLETLEITAEKDEVFGTMIMAAEELSRQESFFSSGKDVAAVLNESSQPGNFPDLDGAHNEVIIRLNTVAGTTLDRRALKESYGDAYQVFNVDVWSLMDSAKTLSQTTEEAEAKFAAMVIYQVATALQLCGPSMKLITR